MYFKINNKNCKSVSHINKHYYSKLQIPIMHRQFFFNSQKPEYVQTHCNDRDNPSHCACRRFYL